MSSAALKEAPPPAGGNRDPINRALVVYTGYGRSSFPRARTGDLAREFGEETAADLRLRILTLYTEMQLPLADEGKRTRKSVTERATEQIRQRHPELEEDGLKALAWAFAFGLR